MSFRCAVRSLTLWGLLLLLLLAPAAGLAGVRDGLACCAGQLIPALFPFFVVTELLLSDPAGRWAGLLLFPLTRAAGIRDRHAPAVLFLGWLGGFAVAARCVSQQYERGSLSRSQAEWLLLAAAGSSPAFVVNAVGLTMLRSRAAGVLLMLSLLAANLSTALLCRPLLHFEAVPSAPPEAPSPGGLVPAVRSAVDAALTVCGFVVFFRFLLAVLGEVLPLTGAGRFLLGAVLEVSAGCAAGAALPRYGLYACCAALSVQGLSVLLQLRALTSRALRLCPLVLSRLLHLPLSLCFLRLGLQFAPLTAPVWSSLSGRVLTRSRAPADAAFWLFVLCCVVLHRLHPHQA